MAQSVESFLALCPPCSLLPPSHGLELRLADEAQMLQTFHNNAVEWGRALPTVTDYIASEQRLFETAFARRQCRTLILVPQDAALDTTTEIVAQCELYFRQALVAPAEGAQMKLVDIVSVAGVFVPLPHRNLGHGSKLMLAIRALLAQLHVSYSTLYSDIGDRYYAKYGWHPSAKEEWRAPSIQPVKGFPSSIKEYVQATLHADPLLKVYDFEPVDESCLASLIQKDVVWMRQSLAAESHFLTLLPTVDNVLWHWSRPVYDYQGRRGSLLQGMWLRPRSDARLSHGSERVASCPFYVLWKLELRKQRLMVLRLSLPPSIESSLAPLLLLLQHIAAYYGLEMVELWNPIPQRVSFVNAKSPALIQQLASQGFTCNTHKKSLSCLYQQPCSGLEEVSEWIFNEALFWC